MAEGYRDVEVRDMASSWKSGLAFCAIIHRFRPDLIDYDSLSKENVFDNNNLAFEVAEKELSIPAFLEAQDMVAIKVPDKLSVVTYVSQYYNYFHNKPQLGGPGVNEFKKGGKKKDNVIITDQKTLTPTHINTGKAATRQDRQESMGDKCSICHDKVYLLERHIESAKLYHRSCYRRSELSPQSRLSKRQPQRSNDEDSSKFRRLDHDKNQSNNKQSDSGQDFWQRRAEAKAKDLSSQSPNKKVTPVSKVDDTPSWKKTETPASKVPHENDVVMQSPKGKPKFDKGGDLFNQNKQSDSGVKTNRLADKFKQLDERNLKASQSDQKIAVSNDIKGLKDISSQSQSVTTGLGPERKVLDKNEQKSPVAKPRQNIVRKDEKMDTSENSAVTAPRPRPVPRYQVKIPPATDPDKVSNTTGQTKKDISRPKTPPNKGSEISLPSKGQETEKAKSPPFKHKEFSKPSSPQKPKSEFIAKSISHSKDPDSSHSKAPLLPSSVPPTLPTSSPPQLKKSEKTSPTPSPRQPVKMFHKEDNVVKRLSPRQLDKPVHDGKGTTAAPAKPPRISTNLNDTNKTRDISPMETDTFAPAKAVFHDPQPEQKAFVTEPKKHNVGEEKKNREVFGGLLKSLADVRQKHDAESKTDENSVVGQKHGASQITNVATDKEKVEIRTKKKSDESAVKFSNKIPPRPKSSFVSGRSEAFLNEGKTESHTNINKGGGDVKLVSGKQEVKTKVTEKTVVTTKTVTTVVDDDTPAWKRQLDKRKADGQRPKSVDVLSIKSETDTKPDWQKEAERRMVARKGAFVDPEKAKIDENLKKQDKISDKNNSNTQPAVRPFSPPLKKATDIIDKYVPPVDKGKVEENEKPKEKRRILPAAPQQEDISPPKQQEGKKKITVGTKFYFDEVEIETVPKRPQRPVSPAKSPGPPRPPQPVVTKPGKHHMSAYQIQKELEKIDTKLTELELKGRSLEDAIRNAKEEEEDDLMIGWFKLVSDKNELVREEADIIYISREQELEVEQKTIEQQLREIVEKPDLDKSTEEQHEQEYLMNKYLDIVNQRNSIVDSMDDDRLRYIEEDKDIEQMLKDKAFKLPPPKLKKKKGKHLRLGFSKDRKDGKLKKDKKKSKLL